MRRFLDLIREDRALRKRVDEEMKAAGDGFAAASAVMSPKSMREALMLPGREGTLTVTQKNILNVTVPQLAFDTPVAENGAEGVNYGFAFTSGSLDSAVSKLTAALPDLIRLAELEKAAQLLADEIERTRRRVNALEYIMIPQYEETIRSIMMKLDENERGNTTRLMKVKDMIAEKALSEKKKADLEDAV